MLSPLEKIILHMFFRSTWTMSQKKLETSKQKEENKPKQNTNKKITHTHALKKKKSDKAFSTTCLLLLPQWLCWSNLWWAKHIPSRERRQFNIESWLFHMVSQMENHKSGWGFTAKQNSLEKGENICTDAYIKSNLRKPIRHLENYSNED